MDTQGKVKCLSLFPTGLNCGPAKRDLTRLLPFEITLGLTAHLHRVELNLQLFQTDI